MRDKKVKIQQYRVRGKHRDYEVLVFPRKSLMFAYFEDFDWRYEIDCDQESLQFLKYALAALIADPQKIVYFPIRGEGLGVYFQQNYDAVLTRPEAQLRRSEWVRLRRQLDRAHQAENFVLRYQPARLCAACGEIERNLTARTGRREKQEVNTLCGDTVFMTLLEESCYLCHRDILETEQERHWTAESSEPFGRGVNGYIGWLIHHQVKKKMLREAREKG